ncbi:hypothetical protein CCACVL1_24549 [Corchorus capsularis]|uniref:Uncharacterized protein n=1 Tax=Corchorus capsularis TaxID=210143 RepID=A0A1R3GPG0_COCAP|nr:hypothetical protein CCACVL1_24549 [Corchorus capsularis]
MVVRMSHDLGLDRRRAAIADAHDITSVNVVVVVVGNHGGTAAAVVVVVVLIIGGRAVNVANKEQRSTEANGPKHKEETIANARHVTKEE